MKRYKGTVLAVLLALLLMSATVQAQGVTPSPQVGAQIQELARVRLAQVEQDLQVFRFGGQRAGGGRGNVIDLPAGARVRVGEIFNGLQLGGAWWTNTALVQQLGLTDDQKTKIERAYENHRQKIMSDTEQLDKEEAQLAKLLAADPIDRNAVLGEVDRVVQARGEMERENSAMTLEMRETLTRAQWTQLQASPQWNVGKTLRFYGPTGERGAAPVPTTGPGARGRGGRGQQ